MYTLVKKIRNKDVKKLAQIFKNEVSSRKQNWSGFKNLRLHGRNKKFIRFLLARITNHIENRCGIVSNFEDYIRRDIKKPFQVEHIWSDNFDEHTNEFDQEYEFEEYRNKIGSLLLLPDGFNQSYGSLPYEKKLPHYFGQNLLAKTLSQQCYVKNPSFLRYKKESKLPFKPYNHFKKKDIKERQKLYRKISEEIWDIEGI